MFEQSTITDPKGSAKPYSMLISLLLQIAVIGVLCVVPLMFPHFLPLSQLKSEVLAAPPKPATRLRVVTTSSVASAAPRVFHLSDLLFQVKQRPSSTSSTMETAGGPPAIDVGGQQDSGGVPFGAGAATPLPVPPPVAEPNLQKQGPVRVGSISAANMVHMVQPLYPPLARAARVQGTVEFTATISKQGRIENLQLMHGHPLLVRAAIDAVMQWRYRPTLLNGQPVEVITDIVVNFNLSQ